MRLYVKGLSPEQAASAEEIRNYYAREPASPLRAVLGLRR
jgi:hypothetical protein